MPSVYWLVSLPLQGSGREATWAAAQDKLAKLSFETQIFKARRCQRRRRLAAIRGSSVAEHRLRLHEGKLPLTATWVFPGLCLWQFHIPELRIGTLDSLLALSDDLVKNNNFVEAVVHKIRRQLEDMEKAAGVEAGTLSVDGVPIESYLTRFAWDEAKYPVMNSLRETVETIHESVAKLEDDLKIRAAEYNTVRSQLNTITRKAGGSMAVRDLSTVVDPNDIIQSEHLTTLLIIVPKYSEKEWLAKYETLSNFVVPRSSKKVCDDNEYSLFTVTLFHKVADTFRTSCREQGFQVREAEHDPASQKQRQEDLERLTEDQESMRSLLIQWCHASYGEVFSSWVHMAAIRVFAESILRYGLPPQYLSTVLAPDPRSEKKLRQALDNLSSSVSSSFWKGADDAGLASLLGGEAELHPYISYTINLAG
eukprot:SM000076S21847  [mRNA]  locus=s76:491940:495057:+ [translate_table: standard]